jgi:hypothetical protein
MNHRISYCCFLRFLFMKFPMIVSFYVHESGQFLKSFASSSKMYKFEDST